MRGAAVVLGIDDREAAAAHPALEQAAQQILAAVGPVEGVAVSIPRHDDPDLRLACLDRLPQLVANDLQIGHRDDLPLAARVRRDDLLAGAWVLYVRAVVPHVPPGIDPVLEKAGATVKLTADRGVTPIAPARAGHAGGIELLGDRARADPGGEELKDAPDHGSLGGVDPSLPSTLRAGRQDVVVVGLAARNLALERPAELPPLGLLGQVLKIHLGHGAEHADVHGSHFAGRDRCG
jgi:hypothetical protein